MDNMKRLNVYQSGSLRDVVGTVNSANLQKDDIVTIMQDGRTEEFILLYYK